MVAYSEESTTEPADKFRNVLCRVHESVLTVMILNLHC